MRKLIIASASGIALLGLAACSDSADNTSTPPATTTTEPATPPATTTEPATPPAADGTTTTDPNAPKPADPAAPAQ